MAMTCPVCRARNDCGPQCRRCRADLSLLLATQERGRHYVARAAQNLLSHAWEEADTQLCQAEAVQRSAEAAQLRALCALLQRDYPQAWAAYQAARQAAAT